MNQIATKPTKIIKQGNIYVDQCGDVRRYGGSNFERAIFNGTVEKVWIKYDKDPKNVGIASACKQADGRWKLSFTKYTKVAPIYFQRKIKELLVLVTSTIDS